MSTCERCHKRPTREMVCSVCAEQLSHKRRRAHTRLAREALERARREHGDGEA